MTRALIVVDVQVDFCEGGSLPIEGGNALAARIAAWLKTDRGYDTVIATRDWHVDPGRHFADQPDYVRTWPAHAVADTPGAAFHPALADVRFDEVFSKGQYDHGYSGFDGTDSRIRPLSAYLRTFDITDVDMVGMATDYCLGSTALDAARLGWRTRVMTDLMEGVAEEGSAAKVSEMRAAGVEFIPSDDA